MSGSGEVRCSWTRSPALPAVIILAIIWLSPQSISALDPDKDLDQFCVDVWLQEQGLPQNTVHAIIQTRDGYLWMGTQEGLVRFDGAQFTVFDKSNTPAFQNQHIQAICEARDGSIWLGTFHGGLLRLRAGEFEVYGAERGVRGDDIVSIAEDHEGAIWIATVGEGLYCFKGGRFVAYRTRDGLPSDRVERVIVDSHGNVWAGTAGGLARISGGEMVTCSSGARDGCTHVTALCEDREGNIWVGTTQGLRLHRGGQVASCEAQEQLRNDLIKCFYEDREGSMWVGTVLGLSRFRNGEVSTLTDADGLSSSSIEALQEDHEGSLWIGTNGGGLDRLREGKVVTYTRRHGLSNENIYSVCGDGAGGLWVGTEKGEIYHFVDGRFALLQAGGRVDPSIVRAILRDRSGSLWIATERGLYEYDGVRIRAYTAGDGLPAAEVRAIYEDRAGTIWVGTDGAGLGRLVNGRFRCYTTKDGLASDQIRAIIQRSNRDLWIGTYAGLSQMHGETFTNMRTADGLSSNQIRSLHEDADGVLWIGTYGGGLNRLAGGRITRYGVRDGLYNEVVFQLLEDSRGRLWMSCNKGIFAVGKTELAGYVPGGARKLHCAVFGKADGMASGECNGGNPAGWKTPDGRLWFGSLKGLVSVDPESIQTNTVRPPVLIESVVADSGRLSPLIGLDLPPGTRRLEFHYTALSFLAPEKMRFSYRMEGLDDSWLDAGTRRVAYYTHVPPGHYEFTVIASNNDGVWNREGASLDLSIRPHYYETTLFQVSSLAAILISSWLVYHMRIRQIRRHEKILEWKVDEAVARIKILGGLLPICAACKRIRDDKGYWNQIENYIRDHSQAEFTHGICPECTRKLYPELNSRETPEE